MKYNFYAEKRALRTFLQAFVSGLVAYASIWEVDFMAVIGIAALSGFISLLMGWVMKLPEDENQKKIDELKRLVEDNGMDSSRDR